jgi:peroxiredoxin
MRPFVKLAVVLALAAAVRAGEKDPPKVGDAAPPFTLTDEADRPVSLSDFAGRKAVVLAFFPKAFTGG